MTDNLIRNPNTLSARLRYARLSPFEEYMIRDERHDFPMKQEMLWRFKGSFDPELLTRAFWTAAAVEPLCNATVRQRWGRYYWDLDSKTQPEFKIINKEDNNFAPPRSGHIRLSKTDITKQPGVCVRVERENGGFTVFTSIHHAVTDGIGITRFIGNWFAVYRRFREGTNDVTDLLPDPALFFERENLHFTPPEPVSPWNLLRGTVKEVCKWFCRRPIPLAPLARREPTRENLRPFFNGRDSSFEPPERAVGDESQFSPLPVLYWTILPASFLDRYKRRSVAENQSLNTLITTDMYSALQQWVQKRKGKTKFRKNTFFRFLIPMSVRSPEHSRLPMVNLLGYVFLDFPPVPDKTKQEVAVEIGETVRFAHKWLSGAIFLEGVRFFRHIPLFLSFVTSRLFCHCSVVFSNPGVLGRFFEFPPFREAKTIRINGELELIQVVGAPPVRPNTPVSVGLICTGEETTLSVCLDEKSFSYTAFLDFLNEYLTQAEADTL